MKSHIKICYCDFWPSFNYQTELYHNILKDMYDVEVVDTIDKDIDLMIYSSFGDTHTLYYDVKKLYISGENDYPNYNQCDYAITHTTFENERHIRVPLWVFYYYQRYMDIFIQKPSLDESYFNRSFCADVISNINCAWPLRQQIVKKLSEYKNIAHGGMVDNNVGGPVDDKIAFLSNYKFSLAIENSDVPGYVTEKLFEAYVANTIPIYLGTPEVIHDFNPNSFINISNYNSYSKLIADIKKIDEDKDLYMEMINSSRMISDHLYNEFYIKLHSFLQNIIENGKVYNHKYGRIGYMNSLHMYF